MKRRSFILAASAAVVRAQDRPNRDMLIRSARPEDLEMPLSGFADYITPIEHFFVRTHVYVPTVNANEWRLKIEGEVASPLTLTLDDLKKLPAVELVSVVECAGNGRGNFEPPVPGAQWSTGGVGNARWRGARLGDVLKRAGMKESARQILFDGADVPLGTMADFQRSIPVKKALDPHTLLAYEMNGETLPVKHGFPVRVAAPGWASDSWVKWVTGIRVLDKEFDGFWMKSSYRRPPRPVAPGAVVAAEQMEPVASLRVKSVIAEPRDGTQAAAGKPLTIRGVAWSGDAGPVTSVEVSVDGGRRWKAAALQAGQRTQFGWRQWEFSWTPTETAYYTILARARDAAGNTQPFDQEWNPGGYGWNVVPRVSVDVVREVSAAVAPAAIAVRTPAPPAGFRGACGVCH
ncbi:MAG TPA: sulfite oxidase, partial [Bryobacteraceae bacterium]|nr:sulfite oxidase [Bryobacteraceae bacterium]